MSKKSHQPAKSTPGGKQTIGQWLEAAPNARVTRNELMRVLEGMVVTRPEVIDMLRDYEQARRQHAWWRRLLRWIRGLFVQPKRSIEDLTPEQREALKKELASMGEEVPDA
jgi:hypothetical protein